MVSILFWLRADTPQSISRAPFVMKTMRNLLLQQITSAESPNRWSKVTSADICAEYLHEFCVYSKFGKSTAFYL